MTQHLKVDYAKSLLIIHLFGVSRMRSRMMQHQTTLAERWNCCRNAIKISPRVVYQNIISTKTNYFSTQGVIKMLLKVSKVLFSPFPSSHNLSINRESEMQSQQRAVNYRSQNDFKIYAERSVSCKKEENFPPNKQREVKKAKIHNKAGVFISHVRIKG